MDAFKTHIMDGITDKLTAEKHIGVGALLLHYSGRPGARANLVLRKNITVTSCIHQLKKVHSMDWIYNYIYQNLLF